MGHGQAGGKCCLGCENSSTSGVAMALGRGSWQLSILRSEAERIVEGMADQLLEWLHWIKGDRFEAGSRKR